jgi:transposase
MVRLQLNDRQWQKVKAVLGVRNRAGRPGRDDRNFMEAVLWWRRTGAPWRDLPSDFGPWKTVFNRFDRWASKGLWQRSDAFRAALDCQGCLPVIPSNGSRAGKLPYDKQLYKSRSEIECTFNLLKQARRFATRYEKTLRNYAAVVALGCALLWLRV